MGTPHRYTSIAVIATFALIALGSGFFAVRAVTTDYNYKPCTEFTGSFRDLAFTRQPNNAGVWTDPQGRIMAYAAEETSPAWNRPGCI